MPKHLAWSNMSSPSISRTSPAPGNDNVWSGPPSYNCTIACSRKVNSMTRVAETIKRVHVEESAFEEQQIKLFGGEPGDDPTLCFRMLEAFGRMEWIDG